MITISYEEFSGPAFISNLFNSFDLSSFLVVEVLFDAGRLPLFPKKLNLLKNKNLYFVSFSP